MRGRRLLAFSLALAVAGCGVAPVPTPTPAATNTPAAVISTPSASPRPRCPDDAWPPFPLHGVPGLRAASIDRVNLVISNATDRTWHYRIAGWRLVSFETCDGFEEREVERGPIRPGEEIRTTLGYLAGEDAPITVAFWRNRCGEACADDPEAGVLLVRSPLEPPSS